MKSSARFGLVPLIALLATSCATLTKEDVEIVNRAKTIHRYPVSRDKFIKTLGLGGLKSDRFQFQINWGRNFREVWLLPSGNLVEATDDEPVSEKEMTPECINQIIGPHRKPYDAYLDRGPAPSPFDLLTPPPRKFFKYIRVTSPRGKVFFSSTDFLNATNKDG